MVLCVTSHNSELHQKTSWGARPYVVASLILCNETY